MAELVLSGLTRHYGSTVAVDRLDLHVADHEFMTLLGPSGSGKTTVLRMIAGHVEPTAGTIAVDGREIQRLPPERRDIGMVFQSYALFPHMTVFKNVAFGLDRRRVPRPERDHRVSEALDMVKLTGLESRLPRQLSGGQQQRVALARAIVIRPTLLLLDEPLSNLDARLRNDVRLEIRRLQRELGITTILVTHDQEEALTVSDRIAVLNQGRLQQVAPPDQLYRAPANRFVASFIGKMNVFEAAQPGDSVTPHQQQYRLPDGAKLLGPPALPNHQLAVRPEVLRLGEPPAGIAANVLRGEVEYVIFLGEATELGVRLSDGSRLVVRTSAPPTDPATGQPVTVWWPVDQTLTFPRD
jgi:putative spermidine/putrescine transport system ATP-binding protein